MPLPTVWQQSLRPEMSRIDRLFELVQLLRRSRRALTAREIAETLEVSLRTIYRDCASLQAMGVPVEGEAGVGYVMRRGYDLPPLAFTREEAEAVLAGLRMLGRTGDGALISAAARAESKLVVARQVVGDVADPRLLVSQAGAPVARMEVLRTIRNAVDTETRIDVRYRDRKGQLTQRGLRPLCLIYYPDATVLAAWCELRQSFRHFRVDWFEEITPTGETFSEVGKKLRAQWRTLEGWSPDYPGAVGHR